MNIKRLCYIYIHKAPNRYTIIYENTFFVSSMLFHIKLQYVTQCMVYNTIRTYIVYTTISVKTYSLIFMSPFVFLTSIPNIRYYLRIFSYFILLFHKPIIDQDLGGIQYNNLIFFVTNKFYVQYIFLFQFVKIHEMQNINIVIISTFFNII